VGITQRLWRMGGATPHLWLPLRLYSTVTAVPLYGDDERVRAVFGSVADENK